MSSTGIPRTSRELTREAKKLGYHYSHSTGGHQFFYKNDPDASIGQETRLIIPTDVKTEKTLRNILKSMAYFEANGLDKAGHPLRVDPAEEGAKQQKLVQSKFVHDMRDWKTQMKRYARGIVEYPGHQPERPDAPKV